MNRKILGQIGRLKSHKREEYIQLHSAVWPGVLKTIKDCHIEHYSIFIRDNLVFAYYEYSGADYESDMKKMADDSITQKWWEITKPCFEKYNANSPEAFYETMQSIFYLD